MPIQIVEPLTGMPFGPFIRVQASSDLIGPIPVTWQWRLRVLEAPPGEETIFEYLIATNGQRTLDTLLQPNTSSAITQPLVDKRTQQGQPVVFKVILENEGSVVEEAQTSPVWDWLSGTAWSQIGTNAKTYSDQDRVVLMGIGDRQIGALLWELVGELLPEITEFIAGHLPTAFQPIVYSPLVCDETVLVRPTLPPLVRWVGIRWRLVQWPSGLGIVDGFPDHTYGNWGQISLTKLNTDAQAIVYESQYESRREGEMLWGTNEPYNVQVYVLPGVCVEFSALSGPPWSAAARAAHSNND